MQGHIHKRTRSNEDGKQVTAWYVVVDVDRGPDGRRRQKWHGGFRPRREAEVLGLRWGDVSFQSQRVSVRHTIISVAYHHRSERGPEMIGQVTERATAMWDDGARWDEILATLRGEGFSKVACIRATVEVLRLPLADAKRIVHESRAWGDRRDNDDRFHEVLETEFRAEAAGG